MDTKIVTIHKRFGRRPLSLHTKAVCQFWMVGKCNRNPCRFLHPTESESLPPNVYCRTSKEAVVLTGDRQRMSFSYSLSNPVALTVGSKDRRKHKSFDHVTEDSPRKRPNRRNSLASAPGVNGSEYKCTPDSSSSSAKVVNMKKVRVLRKCPEQLSGLIAEGDVPEDKTIKQSPEKVCEYWVSGNCVKGDGCQFLHSWSSGDWFSMLAKLKGHTQAVSGITLPSGSEKLYSGSSDGTVRVWDCHTGQSTKVINLGGKIGCLISEGPWIFVGLPNVIKAWNIETAADFSLNVPVGQVYTMAVALDMLFAGAQDGVILAWKGSSDNTHPFQLSSSLKGHTGAVICLTVGDKRLYSGSMDSTIKVWDLNTLQCIHTLNGHTDAVMSLICWEEYLLSCSLDQTIKVWAATEAGNLKVIYTRDEEHGAISLCGIYDAEHKPILFCSCNDKSVYLYDLPSFNKRGMIFSRQEVGTIHIGPNGLFFTGDGMGMLTVWKLKLADSQ